MNARFGDDLCKHFTYVFMGDGCLMEGISQEAISLAGHFKLGRLIAFWDNHSISIDGPTSLAVSDHELERFRASGWHVQEIDGHDTDAIRDAVAAARAVTDQPSMIACKTIIGFGFPTKAGTQKAHGDAPGEEEIAGARREVPTAEVPFRTTAAGAQIVAVRQGLGMTTLPCFVGDPDPLLVRVPGTALRMHGTLWLLTQGETRKTRRVRLFTEFVSRRRAAYVPLLAGLSSSRD